MQTYELFIRSSIGKEEFTNALMGSYEAFEKFPENELFKELFLQVKTMIIFKRTHIFRFTQKRKK
jgi:hypothetical protein